MNTAFGTTDVGNTPIPVTDNGGILTVDGTVTSNQGTANTAVNGWPVKITDGVDTVSINPDGSLNVKQTLNTGYIPTELQYYSATSPTVRNNEWQDALTYTVPNNYNFSPVDFRAVSNQNGEAARVAIRILFGSYNTGTNTFTDGSLYTLPQFASSLYVLVTTLIGNGADDTLTITYTNSAGVAGRTGTVVVPRNRAVGTRILCTLQAGDYGIIDITDVVHTQTGQAGVVTFEGYTSLFYVNMPAANISVEQVLPANSMVIPANQTLVMQYLAAADNKIRQLSLTGPLAATGA